MLKRGYVTVLFGFNYESDDESAEMRSEIGMDAEDTYQRYDFVDHYEVHHENMLADSEASSPEQDSIRRKEEGT